MTASSRGCKIITNAFCRISKSRLPLALCLDCSRQYVLRSYLASTANSKFRTVTTVASSLSSASDAIADDQLPSSSTNSLPIKIPLLSTETHEIHSGVILSRPPLLTPKLHPFEKAFFFYQKRLNERLVIPFTRYFYFKKDTPANTDWKIKIKQRGGVPAKELGSYQAYGKDAWNDELLVKEKHMVEPEYIVDQLIKDARPCVTEDGVIVQDEAARVEGVENPNSRTTEADLNNDIRRLDRLLDRTLYLVVRSKDTNSWGFPSGEVLGRENLYEAAERILFESCGVNMNTWIVGHVPIAHHIKSLSKPHISRITDDDDNDNNQKNTKNKAVFFMKGRIMAGQADLSDNYFNLDDYCWLTKEEISRRIPSDLFSSVDNIMQER